MGSICCNMMKSGGLIKEDSLHTDYGVKDSRTNLDPILTTFSQSASKVNVFKTHLSLDKGNIGKRIKLSFTSSYMQTQKLHEEEEKKRRESAITHKTKTIHNFQIAVNKIKQEESKEPDSVRSHDDYQRKASLAFQMTPAYFRSEKEKLNERYEILEIIGKGGYGEVKRIRDRNTNDIRALKLLLKNQCHDAKEFSEEIQILQRLVF